jgi:hypothetical protein
MSECCMVCAGQRAEAEHALARAVKILEQLGVTLNQAKTRIVRITRGFEFLGFKIQRGKGKFRLAHDRIKSKLNRQNLYAIPTQGSDQDLSAEEDTSAFGRSDRDDQPDHPRMGKLLLSLPC